MNARDMRNTADLSGEELAVLRVFACGRELSGRQLMDLTGLKGPVVHEACFNLMKKGLLHVTRLADE